MRNILIPVLLTFFTGMIGELVLAGQDKPEAAQEYDLVYSQDFEGNAPLDDFVFSDPEAWRLTRTEKNNFLELLGGPDYDPPHRSPSSVALLAHRQFGSFVLQARIKYTGSPDAGHGDHCVFFGFKNPAQFYYTHIGIKQDDVSHQIHIVNNADRTPITIKSFDDGFRWPQKEWTTVRVVRDLRTGRIEVYAGDMNEPTLVSTDKNLKKGWIGFGSFGDTGQVDDIRVWAKKEQVRERKMDQFESK